MSSSPPLSAAPLARQARERFVAHMEGVLGPMTEALRTALSEQLSSAQSSREMQVRRDNLVTYERHAARWADGTAKAWRRALLPATATAKVRMELGSMALMGDDVVENKILSSRLAMAIQEKGMWDLNDLKLRVTHLEGGDDLASEDILRPEALCLALVEQWTMAGLDREVWTSVKDVIQGNIVPKALEGYNAANAFLVERGVLPEINLSSRVRRPAAGAPRPAGAPASEGASSSFAPVSGAGSAGAGGGGAGGAGGGGAGGFAGSGSGGFGGSGGGGLGGSAGSAGGGYGASGGAAGGGGQARGAGGGSAAGSAGSGGAAGGGGGGWSSGRGGPVGAEGGETRSGVAGGGGGGGGGSGTGYGGVAEETRMMTATSPLARARARASGVLGQLKRLLTDKVAGFSTEAGAVHPSPALAEAMSMHATHVQTQVQTRAQEALATGDIVIFDDDAVEQVAHDLRARTQDLKKKASTQTEKATIEIVALMFQSILAEERIPPAVRVWFARLQMPVLRVALAEPEFFGSLEHPARQLIDRMGSCVLGFDAAAISGSALETEIKRVVQVIEQYPETGRRVFQLVYEEFQRFLAKFLTEKGATQKLVSVAQQVEQKETMAVQYTIELRKMLSDVPVRDEIREFLFKVWAEVLAVAAVKHGPQHQETLALKKSAGDLVWAASAKPNRQERAKVIQDLPGLLERLRRGMTLLGLQQSDQEFHIKVIGDTLADAFMSKTEAIPYARIESMTKRLANLEDFVSEDDAGELPLDKENIELMLGIDASMIEVISAGGSNPTAAMLSWARELQPGTWFTLDHNSSVVQVQYVWKSERGQLHLFASQDGRSYIVQLRRLASYLQAGLLVPTEEEALTVRATRQALAKLDANPERLLK
ncbi:DUF1631 family protein [Ramlibacter sp.]|uniref:DUF1631 family protein n=1 Tax=Ramlibacter sp. TaxID=1917967 RepID=UPI0035B22E56